MKKFLINASTILKNFLFLVVFIGSIICVKSQSEGEWKIIGEKSHFEGKDVVRIDEDLAGNIKVTTYIPKYEIGTGIYTAKGEWIDPKAIDGWMVNNWISGSKKEEKINLDNFTIPPKEKVYGMKRGVNNQICVFTKNGLLLYDNDKFSRHLEGVDFKEFNKAYLPLMIDNYVITEDEIFYFEKDRFNNIWELGKKAEVYKVELDTLNRLWVLTNRGILLCENGSTVQFLENVNFEKHNFPRPMLINDFVISKNGIYFFENGEFEKIREVGEPESYQFIQRDFFGRDWFVKKYKDFGPDYYTVLYYFNGNWTEYKSQIYGGGKYYYRFPEILHFRPDSSIWINGRNFIGIINDDTISKLPIDQEKIPKYFVYDKMIFDKKQNIYIACMVEEGIAIDFFKYEKRGGFLIQYDGDKLIYYTEENEMAKLKQTFIADMLVDKKNNLWMATGLPAEFRKLKSNTAIIIKKTPETVEIFNNSKGFDGGGRYQTIFEDSKGRIWIGSKTDGIYMYEYND